MNVKFKRTVAVDFENTRTTEIEDKTFRSGQVIRDVTIEKLSRNFSNLHYINGDLAISVPNDSFDIV
jgi:hypothetical protein